MAEIEFEVPGSHEPCASWDWTPQGSVPCRSVIRAIRHVPSNMGRKLVCENGHNQLGNAPFIPGHEFDVGGLYYGIVPPEFLPKAQSMQVSRWWIPATAEIHLLEIDACVDCDVPTYDFYSGPDISEALPWLSEHVPELHAEIEAQAAAAGTPIAEWTSVVDLDLQRRIRERLDMSRLDIEHTIPKKIGNALWPLLTRPERTVLQATLLAKMCRRCNLRKSKKLTSRPIIEQWYAKTYFDGNLSAARADQQRWDLISRTLDKIYEQRSVG